VGGLSGWGGWGGWPNMGAGVVVDGCGTHTCPRTPQTTARPPQPSLSPSRVRVVYIRVRSCASEEKIMSAAIGTHRSYYEEATRVAPRT